MIMLLISSIINSGAKIMMPDNYSKHDMLEDLSEIKEHIADENLQGAAITTLIDDIKEHYEVASRFNWKRSKGHYGNLLSRLIKTYGH